jgi:hypothetical protein
VRVHPTLHPKGRKLQLRVPAALALAAIVALAVPPPSAGAAHDATLRARVDGRVVSFATGRPVVGAIVAIPDEGLRTTTASDGTFAFADTLAAGRPFRRISAVVTAPGFGSWTVRGLPLRPGETLQLNAELRSRDWTHEVRGPETRSGSAERALPSIQGGNTCTGWDFDIVPPKTIRVYLHDDQLARKYDFYFYVTHVLPSEWIPSWDADALAAGAIAVKTYAWYRAMDGHAYSAGTSCADVTDSTADQVFDPTYSYPTTDLAVYASMGSVLRRNGDIFLAQYWSGDGNNSPQDWKKCEPVTTGTFVGRMSQWGTQVCAQEGMLWPNITRVFYQDTKWKYLRNMLLNPGADSNVGTYPWLGGDYTALARVEGGQGGNWKLTVSPTAADKFANVQQWIPVDEPASSPYHSKVAIRCPDSNTVPCAMNIKIKYRTGSGSVVTRIRKLQVNRDNTWHVVEYDPPTAGVDHVEVSFLVSSKQAFWVDSFYLDTPYGGA